ncbi:hypothetical protein [Polaromonas sp. YR568]|uniref:hypothetical protein n=1 Tax=Polaromonas sp. YR568 TaxID=1855301 RepID=UPI00398C0E4D
MLALLKVKLQPSGEYILKEAGQGMSFDSTIGPLTDAGEFYKLVARRIAELARAGKQIKYIDHNDGPLADAA